VSQTAVAEHLLTERRPLGAHWDKLMMWLFLGSDLSSSTKAVLVTLGAAVGLAYVVVMPQWRYRVHRWRNSTAVAAPATSPRTRRADRADRR